MTETGVFLTRGAEGLDRRGFTLIDVEKMVAAGVLDADERFELIDGEIVPMNAQAMPHMLMRSRINNWFARRAPQDIEIVTEATLVLSETTFFESDVLAFRLNKAHRYIEPSTVQLAVEVADSSRARDLFTKAPRYGAAGVPELWVVELNERLTYVFRGPGASTWANPQSVSFDHPLEALFLPGESVRLAAFEG